MTLSPMVMILMPQLTLVPGDDISHDSEEGVRFGCRTGVML